MAWIEVLKPSGVNIALPEPPPLPPPVEDIASSYEPIPSFLELQQLQQKQKPDYTYTEIDTKSRNDPQVYISTHSKPKQPQQTTGQDQACNQGLKPKHAPTPEICIEESPLEAIQEFRRSRNITDEQCDLVVKMIKKVTASSQPSTLEQEYVLSSPQHTEPSKSEPRGKVEDKINDIDDNYDNIIYDVPKSKPPPKLWNNHLSESLGADEESDNPEYYEFNPEVVCRKKPQPAQRNRHLMEQHETIGKQHYFTNTDVHLNMCLL